MSPSELEEVIYQEPFEPVRMTLSSGDQLVIRHEDRATVSGLCLVLRGSTEPGRKAGGPRLVSIPNIVLVEPVPKRPEGRRRRHR